MDTDTKTLKVIIDPDGDVILVLDDTELQVSSKALSLASCVFKAMLGPHFLEGEGLSTASPKRIPLPDDDAAAMTTLCNILHHRHNSVSKTPVETELLDLATVCDKYDCSEAFSVWSRVWMHYYSQKRGSELKEMAQLLYPFFLLNDAESFKQVSKLTVLHNEGYIVKPKTTDLMPDDVFEVLRRKKTEMERHLCHDLEILLGPILNKQMQSALVLSQHDNFSFCAIDGVRLVAYLKALRNLGVWPLSSAFDDRSIASVCDILATYEEKRITTCSCRACSIDFQQKVSRAEMDAMRSFEGLCLACVKLGDPGTNVFRACQVHKAADVGGSSPR